MPVSDYREFPPPPALAGHLLCLWESVAGSPGAHRVFPDGCIDIVFIGDLPPVIAGPWTEPFTAEVPAGARMVGARWHPGRAPGLLGWPACELLNQTVPWRDMCGRAIDAQLARVRDQRDLGGRRMALAQALMGLLDRSTPVDPAVSAGIHWLARHPQGRIDQLGEWMGISHRQLQRRFVGAVGYGPKMFQSILRFQRLLDLASRGAGSLAAISVDAGYADQSHMTREVQRFAGETPAALLRTSRSMLAMSDFFKTTDPRGC